MGLLLSELSTQIGHLFGSRHGTMAEIRADQTTFAMLQVTEDEQGVSRAEGNVSLTNPTFSTNSI